MIETIGYGNVSAKSPLVPLTFIRRAPEPDQVALEILYCGVCHSDVHQARDEWKNTVFPCIPGHEIVGRVIARGAKVRKFKLGELVGVGCLIDSCRTCKSCQDGLEQYCEKGWLGTYNGPQHPDGSNTFGGYSSHIVVKESFALKIPKKLDPKSVGPILCAGVTTYSPLKHWGVRKGHKVGIVGLGGLGHMAVKLASAMGAQVTVITTSPEKERDAKRLGAKSVLLSTDTKAMEAHKEYFDYILSTIPEPHDVSPYMELLTRDGALTVVGCLVPLAKGPDMNKLVMKRRTLAGSLIGGIAETQAVLDFCAKHNILPDVELIPIQKINDAYDRMVKGDVHYRFIIDMASLTNDRKTA